jgi:hypothetical protein
MSSTCLAHDRAVLLQRIAVEKDRCVDDFMRRMRLLMQQENALTIPQQQPEPPERLSWPNGARRTRK